MVRDPQTGLAQANNKDQELTPQHDYCSTYSYKYFYT